MTKNISTKKYVRQKGPGPSRPPAATHRVNHQIMYKLIGAEKKSLDHVPFAYARTGNIYTIRARVTQNFTLIIRKNL